MKSHKSEELAELLLLSIYECSKDYEATPWEMAAAIGHAYCSVMCMFASHFVPKGGEQFLKETYQALLYDTVEALRRYNKEREEGN